MNRSCSKEARRALSASLPLAARTASGRSFCRWKSLSQSFCLWWDETGNQRCCLCLSSALRRLASLSTTCVIVLSEVNSMPTVHVVCFFRFFDAFFDVNGIARFMLPLMSDTLTLLRGWVVEGSMSFNGYWQRGKLENVARRAECVQDNDYGFNQGSKRVQSAHHSSASTSAA